MSAFTDAQREEIAAMISEAVARYPRTRFEEVRDLYLDSMRRYGRSGWITTGTYGPEGEIASLKNLTTGEVVSMWA